MASKMLIPKNVKSCHGCKICVIFSSLLSKKGLSLNDAFINVAKGKEGFLVNIDHGVKTDFEELVKVCPRRVFEIK